VAKPFAIGGSEILPGETMRLQIPVARLVTQTMLHLPVSVVHGTKQGPRLWISAAIHGDELNGTEIVRRVLEVVDPKKLHGTLVAVPVVNLFGFLEQSRYLPDRRDLNRSFPGSKGGSLAAQIAHLFMTEIVDRCTHGIDLHTGSHHRTNMPQVRADLDDPEVRRCAIAFGAPIMIHSKNRDGALRDAAARRGIPVLVYEGGETLRFDDRTIEAGVEGIFGVLACLDMLKKKKKRRTEEPVEMRHTHWARAGRSGIVHLEVGLAQSVERRQVLAVIRDAFGDVSARVRAPHDGIVIGHATTPLVHKGAAIVHVGVPADGLRQ
jgi:predicted deacylase